MKRLFLICFLTLIGLCGLRAQTLMHYWNFNTTSSFAAHITPTVSIINGTALDTLRFQGGTSLIDHPNGTGQGFDVNNYNARNSDAAGNHLRFNNPIYGALVFSLPTTGYKDILVKYASLRSGSGAYFQFIYYSTDGSNYTLLDTIRPTTTATLYSLNFSAITAANNNPNFKVRITFGQGGGGTAGNNRIDNFTVEGNSISGNDVIKPSLAFSPLDGSVNISTQTKPSITFSEDVRLLNNSLIDSNNVDTVIILKLNNASGSNVSFNANYSNKVITIIPNSQLLDGQTYYLALKKNVIEDLANNAIDSVYSSTFSTLTKQTKFNPGDLLPIAYRMNAITTDDEMALLSTVNILPGTLIYMTDAKYTDNPQAQCAGGFVWTAPSEGIAAGTVISIKNDVPSVNIGSLSGSGFGLSSGGDQFIVYTGGATSASHITALSSNLWVSNNISCSGSVSKIPAMLSDGISSINLSTASGNVLGNTANAYYRGPQNLPLAQLRDSILNPANWIGTASGTAAQIWPIWAFDGPPVVVSTKVISNSSIQLVFNKDLDNSSSTNLSNFTGIAGLSSVKRSNNGSKADTLTLIYSNPFINNASYTLTVMGVKDQQLTEMFKPYKLSFIYSTKIAFEKNFAVLDENAGNYILNLNVTNPSSASIELTVKGSPFSTAVAGSDFTLQTQTVNITGTTSVISISIPVINDTLAESDEYFVLELKNAVGVAIEGKTFATIYIKDNDKKAPAPSKEIELNFVRSFKPDSSGSTCEIVAYDSISKRLFMTSAIEDRLDIANFSNPALPTLIRSIDMSVYGGITSVAVKNGIVAVASPNANEQLNGKVVFFDANGNYLKDVNVGALPDMICFSPDGKMVLTANEGQPSADYSIDPEGSVSIIDISSGITGLTQSNVSTLLFTDFNSQESSLITSGVRKLKTSSTLSQDFEPEYITVSSDSKKAWIALQENNAIAELDLSSKTYKSVWALGSKDWSTNGNGFDASDNNQNVLLASWPVKSFYIPDAVVSFQKNGVNYILTANEGDEKEYGSLNERTTIGAVTYKLDSAKFPQAAMLKESFNLGRLRVTNLNGDTDGDGDFDQIYTVGTRSFSIFNADSKTIVYDSKDDFEQFTSKDTSVSAIFNADNESNTSKGRSRAKGPEPEGACLANINGRLYSFIGLERVGGVMVYNITNPAAPVFSDYKNSRSKTTYNGDHGPEGIIYLSDKNSPDGKHYILVANELSGTISIYQLKINTKPVGINALQSEISPILAYPNPANGNEIRFSEVLTAVVFDILGNEVAVINDSDFLNTSLLESGVYFVKELNGQTIRILIQK
jgi:hypothetical protein